MIIGISGKKGSGKTTVAMDLYDHLGKRPVAVIPFAKALKELVLELFPVEQWMLDGTEREKNTATAMGLTARELMQLLGQGMRTIWAECWVYAWGLRVWEALERLGPDTVVLVPDVRYPNEVEAIHAMGGKVIRLTRAPHQDDRHESEVALDGEPMSVFDVVSMNAGQPVADTLKSCRQIVDVWLEGGR